MCAISYSKQLLTQVIIFDKFRKDFFRSMKKQPTFRDAITFLPAKWRLRNDCRNSILMVCHYPDQGSASDWLCRVVTLLQRHVIGMEFLQCLLRCHFAKKPVVASRISQATTSVNDNYWKDIDSSTVLTRWTSVLVDWILLLANCDNMEGTLK